MTAKAWAADGANEPHERQPKRSSLQVGTFGSSATMQTQGRKAMKRRTVTRVLLLLGAVVTLVASAAPGYSGMGPIPGVILP